MDEAMGMPLWETVPASGVEFPVVSVGDGEPVLFVHGAWSDHRIWHAHWRQVADRHQFLACTQRHFGPWAWPTDNLFSRDVHTSDLVQIITALDTPVRLVGWSYAGAILLGAAHNLPRQVRSLVLYEPSLPELLPDNDEGQSAAEEFWRGLEPAYDIARRGDLDAGIRCGLEFVFGLADGGFADLDESTQRVFLANTHTMFPDLEAPAPTPLTSSQLNEISQPALVISGEMTHATYHLEAQALAGAMPSAKLATMAGVGHGGPVQKPAGFAALVLDFVEHLPR